MFRAAQVIVRNKYAVIAAGVVGLLVFARDGEEAKAVDPWASDASQQAQAQARESLADKAVVVAAGAAKDYAGVDVDKVLPARLRQDTVDNWAKTGEAARRANGAAN